MTSSLTLYKSIKQANECLPISVDQWLGMIKHHQIYSGAVLEARKMGKGDPVFEAWKVREFPCVMPNFIYRGRRITENITGPTGFIYVDYDCEDAEQALLKKTELMQMDYTYATWISLSGLGVGSLIKVDGLTINNFKQFYIRMTEDLRLSGWDKHAATPNRTNVLSYDPHVYINQYSKVYISSLPLEYPGLTTDNKLPSTVSIVSPAFEDTLITKSLVFQTTLPDYSEDCVYIPEGRPYFAATLPFNKNGSPYVTKGKRGTVISSYINNLILLNPHAQPYQVLNILKKINASYLHPSLPHKEIEDMVFYKFANRDRLQPLNVRLKKYWVDPKCGNRWKAYLDKRREPNRLKIEEFIGNDLFNLTQPITLKDFSKLSGVPYATLKRHMPPGSEYRRIFNDFNKTISQ